MKTVVVEVRRRIIFGASSVIMEILGDRQINTAYVERDNLTSRQSNGRLVRKTLSHSKKDYYLQRYRDVEDVVFNFVRPHLPLREVWPQPLKGRKWQPPTPAMAAGVTDQMWTFEELLSSRMPPSGGSIYVSRLSYTAPHVASRLFSHSSQLQFSA